ncbi:MAP kinase kinase PBS2 isoform A, partial [Teratosphaeria destructans]
PFNSSPVVPGTHAAGAPGGGLAAKRGIKLPGGLPGQAPSSPTSSPAGGKRRPPGMTLSSMGGGAADGAPNGQAEQPKEQTEMEKYAEYIDTKNGALTFKGKARVTGQGIEFTSGKTFHISLDEVETLDELGKGNYGTVYKVRHSAPKFRKAGMGLAGNKALPKDRPTDAEEPPPVSVSAAGKNTTGIVMAMKEMRLELDDAKFQSIIMELDILHRCVSPYIIDFYGAFFQEGAVYICIEHMDGGSMDKIYGDGVPENILRKVTLATTLGLKSLKEEHNIIHRDVKPTNILVNTKGQVKICDFGVSGNLVASIARTNIGCQSYMAPERISGGGPAPGAAGGTYSVQSDIWSLGLTIIECAMGRYPYPPETYDNIFSQLAAIVDGAPPDLPADAFSDAARDFVAGCLNKVPKLRPTYPMLLQHAWLAPLIKPATILEEDEEAAEAAHAAGQDITAAADGDGEDEAGFVDREVGEWVVEMLERKRRGLMGAGRSRLCTPRRWGRVWVVVVVVVVVRLRW